MRELIQHVTVDTPTRDVILDVTGLTQYKDLHFVIHAQATKAADANNLIMFFDNNRFYNDTGFLATTNTSFSSGSANNGYIGAPVASNFSDRYTPIVMDLLDWDLDRFIEIKELGPVVAKNVMEYFSNDDNINMLNRMESLGVNMEATTEDRPKQRNTEGVLSGKTPTASPCGTSASIVKKLT